MVMAKTYEFKINNKPHTWEEQFISGAEIRAIPPGIPSSMSLYVKRGDKPGTLVIDEEQIDLDEPGTEIFYSQDVHHEDV
jgi:hypothetical protein